MTFNNLGAPRIVLKTSSLVSGISNRDRFFASWKVTSRMTCDSALTERASTPMSKMLWVKADSHSPVSVNSLPIRPGVPTAADNLVRRRYVTCSSSLKCRAKSLATSPPLSPRSVLVFRILVMSVTRSAAGLTTRRVGAPLFLGFWPRRVRRVGST
jgi:hypothetical protein